MWTVCVCVYRTRGSELSAPTALYTATGSDGAGSAGGRESDADGWSSVPISMSCSSTMTPLWNHTMSHDSVLTDFDKSYMQLVEKHHYQHVSLHGEFAYMHKQLDYL